MKWVAQELAKYGRNGDDQLVHMSGKEIAGLASVTPGGLTTNPHTGLTEAANSSNILQTILPIAAGVAGSFFGMPWLGAAVGGAMEYAKTGNLTEGIGAGLMSYGIGSALGGSVGGMFGDGGDAMAPVGSTGGEGAAAAADAQVADLPAQTPSLTPAQLADPAYNQAMTDMNNGVGVSPANMGSTDPSAATPSGTGIMSKISSLLHGAGSGAGGDASGGGLSDIPLLKNGTGVMPMILGAAALYGQNASTNPAGITSPPVPPLVGPQTRTAQTPPSGYVPGQSPEFNFFPNRPSGMAVGGPIKMAAGGQQTNPLYGYEGITNQQALQNPRFSSSAQDLQNQQMQGIPPDVLQAAAMGTKGQNTPMANSFATALRNQMLTSPSATPTTGAAATMAAGGGIEPIKMGGGGGPLSFLTTPIASFIQGGGAPTGQSQSVADQFIFGGDPLASTLLGGEDWKTALGADFGKHSPLGYSWFNAKPPPTAPSTLGSFPIPVNYAAGGGVGLGQFQEKGTFGMMKTSPGLGEMQGPNGPAPASPYSVTSGGGGGYAEGGIAQLSNSHAPMHGPVGGHAGLNVEENVVAEAKAALQGHHPDPNDAIQRLVQMYGPEAMHELKAQLGYEGGKVHGAGDAMSDLIPGSIDGSQPVQLATDEHVIAGDVVSHLGSGSSEQGHRLLREMTRRVRLARTGTAKQAPQITGSDFLPA